MGDVQPSTNWSNKDTKQFLCDLSDIHNYVTHAKRKLTKPTKPPNYFTSIARGHSWQGCIENFKSPLLREYAKRWLAKQANKTSYGARHEPSR